MANEIDGKKNKKASSHQNSLSNECGKTPPGKLIRATFRRQADYCRELGSPFVERICRLFALRLEDEGVVMGKLWNWPRDDPEWMGAVALRIVGSLHALVLEGRSKSLADVFPPNHIARDDEALWSAIHQAMLEHPDFILSKLESAPQTNEVRRAAALLPGFLTIASITGLPLSLSELGASAGLNLFWDHFGYQLGELQWGNASSPVQLAPQWNGKSPPATELTIHDRAGCDLLPLDPRSHADRMRLLSYIWADQTDRIERTCAALEMAQQEPIEVEKADVLDWLEGRLGQVEAESVHVIYHTIVWPYLSAESQERGEAMIRAAGDQATTASPLAWLRLEPDGNEPGAALHLTLWPGNEERCIARVDFHGRWINWIGW